MMEEEEERRVNKNRREDRKLLESSRSYYDTPDHHSRKAQSSPSHVVGPHHQRRVSYDRTYDNVVVATIFSLPTYDGRKENWPTGCLVQSARAATS